MNLGELLLELKDLVGDPSQSERVLELLEGHQGLAEFEVARFYVSRNLPNIDVMLNDVDPRARLKAVRRIPLAFAAGPAARLLRTRVKDADGSVSAAARAAVKKLSLPDVSLRDARYKPSKFSRGGWNVTGWNFGLFRDDYRQAKRPKAIAVKGAHALATVDQLLSVLGVTKSELNDFARPGVAPGSGYVEFEINKRKGGTRRISAPKQKLKKAQRALLDTVLRTLPVHPAAHGFEKGKSTLTNASPHQKAALVVKMDVKDFFPSIHFRRVLGLFQAYGYPPPVAQAIAMLTTHRPKLADGTVVWPGVLPQGAPTSPAIANLVCRRLDARLTALAKKFDATYTRYADDLTFSFKKAPEKLGRFFWWANAILQHEGFAENEPKRRVMRHSGTQRVTGLVVNEKLAIPRSDRRRFKAILHNVEKNGLEAEAKGNPKLLEWMLGYASYVKMVQPALGAKWLDRVRALKRP